jgi:hypothetical protein
MNNFAQKNTKINGLNDKLKLFFLLLFYLIFIYVYSSRILSDDLLAYSIYFQEYTNFTDIIEAPIYIIVEPILYMFFIIFNFLGLSFRIFIAFVIVLNLYFTYKILRNFYSKDLAVFGLITFMLIPLNMSLSLQVLRQYLSMQIMFYFLIKKNNDYLFFLFSILLHSSSLIFFPLIFVKKKINFKYSIITILFLIVIYYSPIFTYLSLKLSKGSYYSFDLTGSVPYFITGIPLLLVLFDTNYSRIYKLILLYLFLIIAFALSAEMQFRYMVGIYILLPIIIVQLFLKFNKKTQLMLKPIFLLTLMFWTINYILDGPYKYLL